MTLSNDLSSAIAAKVLRFQELLRQHVTPWAVFERLHANSPLLGGYRLLLYAVGMVCVAAYFVPQISGFVFRWGWRLFLSYPVVTLLYLGWWEHLLRHAKALPCRLSARRTIRLPGFVLLPIEDLNGRRLGRLLTTRCLFDAYGFALLRPADQLTVLQTSLLFCRLHLPTELVFDTLQSELTNLTQQWEDSPE